MKTAGVIDGISPGPPAGAGRRESPAMRSVRESIARWGYAHTEPEIVSDSETAAAGLCVVRGLTLDTLYPNTPEGRVVIRGDENLEQLRRLGQKQNEGAR